MVSRGPVIVRIQDNHSGGVQCCCCKCCTCINLGFLKTEPGVYKLAQAVSNRYYLFLLIIEINLYH